MWQKIRSVTKALVSNPIKFLFDPNYYIEYQVTELEAQGKTMAEIDQTLAANGFLKGSPFYAIAGMFKDGFKAVDNTLSFFSKKSNIKALVLILVIAATVYFVWRMGLFRKAAAA